VIFFNVFLSLDQISELYDAMWRKLCGAGDGYRCNRLAIKIAPTWLQDGEAKAFAESGCLGVEK
jgi:hypothetical protein